MIWPTAASHPATATDALFRLPDSSLRRGNGWLVHVTGDRPDYYFGNHLVSQWAPHEAAFDRQVLEQVWQQHLSRQPGIQKKIFQWEVAAGQAQAAAEAAARAFGITTEAVDVDRVLVARREMMVVPRRAGTVEPVCSPQEFQHLVMAAHEDIGLDFAAGARDDFLVWQYDQFERANDAGQSTWWITRDPEGQVCAQCGIAAGEGVGRYREVLTRPAWRRQGYASLLVARAGQRTLEAGLCERLVIVAAADSSAERIYRRAGFQVQTVQMSVRLDP